MNKIFAICLILSVVVAVVLSQECQPGEIKQKECNKCRCTNGVWSCSRKFCIPREKRGTFCTPGSRYKNGCNTCICNSKGTDAACTLRACL